MNNPIQRTTDSYDQKRLVWEGNRLIAESDGSRMLSFFYDCFGSPIGFTYNGGIYAYCKNAFQDVVGIVRDDGLLVAEYSYGDFGEPGRVIDSNGSGIAFLNPFRYRSYYFDQDLGIYYLRSRWYSPELRRFLSPDSPKALLQQASKSELLLNRYSYCANNPIAYTDSTGKCAAVATLIVVTPVCPWLVPFLAAVLVVVAVVVIAEAVVEAVESAQNTSGGTTNNQGASQYQPIPSVMEPPMISEPIIGGDGTITEPLPESQPDPLADPDVQQGLKMLKNGLYLAEISAMLRIKRQYPHQTEIHHVVPENQVDFFQLLPDVRLYMDVIYTPFGVDSDINKIEITTTLHKGLHNGLYVEGVALAFHPITLFEPSIGQPVFTSLLNIIKGEILIIDEAIKLLL